MKKLFCFAVVFALLLSLISCGSRKSSLDAILELKFIGKISGNVYFSGASEEDEYYIDSDLMTMLFFEDAPPKNFALILSPSIDFSYEVMLVIPEAEEDVISLADTLRRRLVLLTGDSEAAPIVTAEFIAYSTKDLSIDLRQTLEKIMT